MTSRTCLVTLMCRRLHWYAGLVIATLAAGAALAAPAAAQTPARERARERQAGRQADRTGAELTERVSRAIRVGRAGTFDLSNVAGDIVITGGSGDHVQIEAVKRTRNQDEAAGRAALQAVEVSIRERSNLVEVRTIQPRNQRMRVAVDYAVRLPEDFDVQVWSVSGDLRLIRISGTLQAGTVSGDIEAAESRRIRSLRTVSGDILLSDVDAPERAELETVSGNQTLQRFKAPAISARSVSGDLRMQDVEVERAELRTLSGDVDYQGRLAQRGRYAIASHSGDIRLTVNDTGFDLEASTFSGNVRSDYNLKIYEETEVGRRRGMNRTVRGAYADGSAILDLRSFSGNIAVIKR